MINSSGRPRPSAYGFGSFQSRPAVPLTPPTSSAANSSIQSQYKPDFLAKAQPSNPQPTTPAPTISGRNGTMSSYQQARAALANPALYGGPMTEKQTREMNWDKRADPIGFRDKMLQDQRIYGVPPSQQAPTAPPSRPTNFNGPSRRFGS